MDNKSQLFIKEQYLKHINSNTCIKAQSMSAFILSMVAACPCPCTRPAHTPVGASRPPGTDDRCCRYENSPRSAPYLDRSPGLQEKYSTP